MKGLFYSLIVVVFILPLIYFSSAYLNGIDLSGRNVVIKTIGDRMSSYSDSISGDLPRALTIISERAIQEAVSKIDTSGAPLDDSEFRLKELMMNGTLYGNATGQNLTFSIWVSELQGKSALYGLNTRVKILEIDIKPYDSFHVKFSANVEVNSTDKTGSMSFYRVYNSTVSIPIESYVDPIYSLKTNGLIKRTVKPVNSINGVSQLDNAITNKLYMNSDDGPSYLERLEGRLSRSPKYVNFTNIGIETIVNVQELQSSGITIKPGQSAIDYLYFDPGVNSGSLVNNSAFSWLRLDANHAIKFGVSLI